MMHVEIAIIGGGPAGMSAAAEAVRTGVKDVLIFEREPVLGGILEQCIHNGFGLHKFKEELTGPEYAERYEKLVEELNIECMTDTMVIDISHDKVITAVNKEKGFFRVAAKAVVLAMGCRERTRGALSIPGERPAGIFTAGTAQKLVNIKGYMPGKRVVILGSGDIGLIMARRLTFEGATVVCVCEIMQDSGGLTRNIVQCLQDYDIPLLLRHTVVKIHGSERLEGVTIAEVDDKLKPIAGSEKYVECDTLMLSVGLIPENELSKKAGVQMNSKTRGPVVDENRQTTIKGIFACGNVVRVHELVDFVSEEGEVAGRNAALYVKGVDLCEIEGTEGKQVEQKKGLKNLNSKENISQKASTVICTTCPMGCSISVIPEKINGSIEYRTEGNTCKRGETFAIKEITAPERTLTTTIMTESGVPVPVKSDKPIPKDKIFDCLKIINNTTLLLPICLGDIIIKGISGTEANIVAARTYLNNNGQEM